MKKIQATRLSIVFPFDLKFLSFNEDTEDNTKWCIKMVKTSKTCTFIVLTNK